MNDHIEDNISYLMCLRVFPPVMRACMCLHSYVSLLKEDKSNVM